LFYEDTGNFRASPHFARLSMKQAIAEAWRPTSYADVLRLEIDEEWLNDPFNAHTLAAFLRQVKAQSSRAQADEVEAGLETEADTMEDYWRLGEEEAEAQLAAAGDGAETQAAQDLVEIFEHLVEASLIQPTFIT